MDRNQSGDAVWGSELGSAPGQTSGSLWGGLLFVVRFVLGYSCFIGLWTFLGLGVATTGRLALMLAGAERQPVAVGAVAGAAILTALPSWSVTLKLVRRLGWE